MYHNKNKNINPLISTIKYYPNSLKFIKLFNILNFFLTLSIFILAVYILIKPILPEFTFIMKKNINVNNLYSNLNSNNTNPSESFIVPEQINKTNISKSVQFSDKLKEQSPVDNIISKDESSIINPSLKKTDLNKTIKKIQIQNINLDSNIHSSNNSKSLYKGIWHKSNSGNPIKKSNMVITAHRFMYTNNSDTFYHLPKLKINDTIIITWEGKDYNYQVVETKIVNPDQIEIEAPTKEHILTLYTCTPLWTSSQRFVVIAVPKQYE